MGMSSPSNGRIARQEGLDVGHLARQTMGDTGLEHELLRLFSRHAAVLMQRIEAGPARERLVAAHTLKGSARAIGAWAVADAAAAAEAAGSSLERLRCALDQADAAIGARLAEGPGRP